MSVAASIPDIPPAPTPTPESPQDILMRLLFGPKNHLMQTPEGGGSTVVNWPAVMKTAQAPEVAAELTTAFGDQGYQTLLRSLLRGAERGADRPSAGSGALGAPFMDMWSGREKGAAALVRGLDPIRNLLPNAGARYVGQAPFTPSAKVQSLFDVMFQRGVGAATEPK